MGDLIVFNNKMIVSQEVFTTSMFQLHICDDEMHDEIPEKINGNVMGVKFEVWLERNPEEWNGEEEDKNYLDLFWERNFYPDFGTLVNDLHKRGLIEEGEYTLGIDW